MYLSKTMSKLGSANAKVHTGGTTAVTRLKRATGGMTADMKKMAGKEKKAMGGATGASFHGMAPTPAASKFKKGKRVHGKREHHFWGSLLGAALPMIGNLLSGNK